MLVNFYTAQNLIKQHIVKYTKDIELNDFLSDLYIQITDFEYELDKNRTLSFLFENEDNPEVLIAAYKADFQKTKVFCEKLIELINNRKELSPSAEILQQVLVSVMAVQLNGSRREKLAVINRVTDNPLYSLCRSLGGHFAFDIQGIDPINGNRIEENSPSGYISAPHCYGSSVRIAKDAIAEGYIKRIYKATHETFRQQNSQGETERTKLLFSYIDQHAECSSIEQLIKMVDIIPINYIYLMHIYDDTDKAHCVLLRKVLNLDMLEFYDSNYGLFIFNSRNSFDIFIKIWYLYYQRTQNFNDISFEELGSHPHPKSSYIGTDNTFEDHLVTLKNSLKLCNVIYKKIQKNSRSERNLAPFYTLAELQNLFLTIFNQILSIISEGEICADIEKHLKESFGFLNTKLTHTGSYSFLKRFPRPTLKEDLLNQLHLKIQLLSNREVIESSSMEENIATNESSCIRI